MNTNRNSTDELPRDPRTISNFYQDRSREFYSTKIHVNHMELKSGPNWTNPQVMDMIMNLPIIDKLPIIPTSLSSQYANQYFEGQNVPIAFSNQFFNRELNTDCKNLVRKDNSEGEEYENTNRKTSNNSPRSPDFSEQSFKGCNVPIGAQNQEFPNNFGRYVKREKLAGFDFDNTHKKTSNISPQFSDFPDQFFISRNVHVDRNQFFNHESHEGSRRCVKKHKTASFEYDNTSRKTLNISPLFRDFPGLSFLSRNVSIVDQNQFSNQELHKGSERCVKKHKTASSEYGNTSRKTLNISPMFSDFPDLSFLSRNVSVGDRNQFSNQEFHKGSEVYVEKEKSGGCGYDNINSKTSDDSQKILDNPKKSFNSRNVPNGSQDEFYTQKFLKDSNDSVVEKMTADRKCVTYRENSDISSRFSDNTSQLDDKESYLEKLPYRIRRMEKKQSKKDYKAGIVNPSNEKRETILQASRNITNEMKKKKSFAQSCKQKKLLLVIIHLNQCRMREIARHSDSIGVKKLMGEYRILHPASLDEFLIKAISNRLDSDEIKSDTKAITPHEWKLLLTGQFRKLFSGGKTGKSM